MVSFEAYKFDYVYEFADIIYKMVEDETVHPTFRVIDCR